MEFESPHPAAASPWALAHGAVVTEDGPHTPVQLGAVATTCERRRSRRPCHPRDISSGQQRYPADCHGLSMMSLGWAPAS